MRKNRLSNPAHRWFLKIFVSTLVNISLTLAITGYFASAMYENVLRENARKSQEISALKISRELRLFFEKSIDQMRLSARILRAAPTRAESIFNETILQNLEYYEIGLFDPQGLPRTISYPDVGYVSPPSAKAISQTAAGAIHISDMKFTRNKKPFYIISVPIYFRNNPAGFISSALSVSDIWTWLDKAGRNKNERIIIVDATTRYALADSDGIEMGRAYLPSETERTDILVTSYLMTPVAPLEVIVQSPVKHLLETLFEIKHNLILLLVLAVVLSGLLGYAVMVRIMRPVNKIVSDVLAFDPEKPEKFEITEKDEFRIISDAINKMIDKISDYQKKMIKQEGLAAIGKTVAILAHEIKNDIHVLMNVRSTFKIDPDFASDVLEQLITRMNVNLKNLLELSRSNELQPGRVEMNDLMNQAYHELKPQAELFKCNLVLVDGQEPLFMEADERKLIMAISNLGRNAFEAYASEVSISWEKHDGFIEISVKDNGSGIAPEIQEKIFEMFFSTKTKGGFGIGMPLVANVVNAHGGEVYIKSTGGNGTEFRIKLPIKNTENN